MPQDVAQPLDDVGAQLRRRARRGGVERPPHERQRDRRDEERRGVDVQEILERQHDEERTGRERSEHHRGREGRLDPAVRRDELAAVDEARDRGELRGLEEDRERRRDEQRGVDPRDREQPERRRDGNGGDGERGEEIDHDHEPLSIDAVGPRADHETEEQMRETEHRECAAEQGRGSGELVHEERNGELRDRRPEVRDGLAEPELPEIKPQVHGA